jgi:hypothetical protein
MTKKIKIVSVSPKVKIYNAIYFDGTKSSAEQIVKLLPLKFTPFFSEQGSIGWREYEGVEKKFKCDGWINIYYKGTNNGLDANEWFVYNEDFQEMYSDTEFRKKYDILAKGKK